MKPLGDSSLKRSHLTVNSKSRLTREKSWITEVYYLEIVGINVLLNYIQYSVVCSLLHLTRKCRLWIYGFEMKNLLILYISPIYQTLSKTWPMFRTIAELFFVLKILRDSVTDSMNLFNCRVWFRLNPNRWLGMIRLFWWILIWFVAGFG